jgi:hypothetical protein
LNENGFGEIDMASSYKALTAEQIRIDYRKKFSRADLLPPDIVDALPGDADGLIPSDKLDAPLDVNLPEWPDRIAMANNVALYVYEGKDPAQLTRVTNSGADYPAVIELEYDEDGHLVRDECGRLLEYDALGRLISVSALPGEAPSGYRYGPLDTLSSRDSGGDKEQRFYQGGELSNQIQGANNSTFMRGEGVVLAEHQAGADPKS